MRNIYALILSGGSGTRLWPLSRENFPKQFLTLHGDKTLLQNTALRMLNLIPLEFLRVISGAKFHELVISQMQSLLGAGNLPENFIIEEPCAKGTAPAILLAVEELHANDDDVIIVVPSDAFIRNNQVFIDALKIGVKAADEGFIATLGISPTRPETGFGYIKQGRKFNGGFYEAEKFVEKPDFKTAQDYLSQGLYLWNGGIFIFTPRILYSELKLADSDLFTLASGKNLRDNFASIKNISFDNALMEKAHNVAVIPLVNSGWSDVGSWDALHDDVLSCDENNNVVTGQALTINSNNCFVHSQNKLAVLNGVNDLIIIDTPDALFITRRGFSQDVKNVVNFLKKHNMNDKV